MLLRHVVARIVNFGRERARGKGVLPPVFCIPNGGTQLLTLLFSLGYGPELASRCTNIGGTMPTRKLPPDIPPSITPQRAIELIEQKKAEIPQIMELHWRSEHRQMGKYYGGYSGRCIGATF